MTEPIRDIQPTAPQPETTATLILGGGLPENSLGLDPRTLPSPEAAKAAVDHHDLLLLDDETGALADAIACLALAEGGAATILTAVPRMVPSGVKRLLLDRNAPGFPEALRGALHAEAGESPRFDLVVDCGGRCPAHARQDLEELTFPGAHVVFLSSDLVYDPALRPIPTTPASAPCCQPDGSPLGQLRAAEVLFQQTPADAAPEWTILRPTLVIASLDSLGAMPPFGEIPSAMRAGAPVPLIAGGHWLVQPISLAELSKAVLSLPKVPSARRAILDCAGTRRMEFRKLCEQFASENALPPLRFRELSEERTLAEHPEYAPYLCHRIYPVT